MMENRYSKIAELVESGQKVQNLMAKVNFDSLLEKHRNQSAKKASGVDGVTKQEYEANLGDNIGSLVSRMKNFSYRPLPVKRTYIPKEGQSDKLRPLGIPAYEDKLVQGVMADILTAVYEPKFLDFSYGFRPRRDCHKAIFALDGIIMRDRVNYVVDADIRGFFDNVNHDWLIKFLEHDIDDKRFIRYIKRFLKSGVMEDGKYLESDKGTPQGGLVSPILANVYLHYVLDLWFEKVIKPHFHHATIIRYADDFVCCFQLEHEARKFLTMLKERLAKFGLEVAEDKTKIIPFGRSQRQSKETFDFLGFTHLNGVTRKGRYKLVHITSSKKLKAKMQASKQWLKTNMHKKPKDIIKQLNVKLNGHYRYYGISDNSQRMDKFRRYCQRRLYRALSRRSQGKLTWEKFNKILEYNPIARPKIYHSTWQSK